MKEKKDKSITTFGDLEDLFLELRNSRRRKQGLPPETRRILVSRKPSKEIIIKLENNPLLEELNQRLNKKRELIKKIKKKYKLLLNKWVH